MTKLKINPKAPQRTRPDKVKAEKFFKAKHRDNPTQITTETVLEYICRVHGITLVELQSVGIKIN